MLCPAGSEASESLLVRARCYGLLGQKKTALFDFNSVLRAEPGNVQALCGRALVYLALDQPQVPGHLPTWGWGPGYHPLLQLRQRGLGHPVSKVTILSCPPAPQAAGAASP